MSGDPVGRRDTGSSPSTCCELERVPNTTDVMATYVVQLDDGGGLLGYKRTRRYQRGQAEEG